MRHLGKWQITRLSWTAALALMPWLIIGFGHLNWNVADWEAFERFAMGIGSVLLGLATFTYPGFRR